MTALSQILADVASRVMSSEPFDVSAFRDLQSFLDDQLEQRLQKEEGFIVLFLSLFLDEVFYNLTGDFPYHLHDFVKSHELSNRWGTESYRIRQVFFRNVAQLLDGIAVVIQTGGSAGQVLELLCQLSDSYLSTISELNRISAEIIARS